MGFTIITDNRQDLVVSVDRLWLTADRERVVADGDPEAAFLLVGAGSTMRRTDAERYGLLDATTPVVEGVASSSGGTPEVQAALADAGHSAPAADLDGLTVAELRELADAEGVDHSGLKTKAQVRDALEAARAEAAGQGGKAAEDAGDSDSENASA